MDARALRRLAADRTFFAPRSLEAAIERLGFVQADPIRAPARAQDLILRQRVTGYRAGDLERHYPTLPLTEEMLHVYGFLARTRRALLHPRRIARRWHVEEAHPRLRAAVLSYLGEHGPSHPRDIERALIDRRLVHPDRTSIVNGWGGVSATTTRMLEVLHHRGLLHVVRREKGIRVYEVASRPVDPAPALTSPRQRADGLIRLLVSLYEPVPRASLGHLVYMLHDRAIGRDEMHERIAALLRRGELSSRIVDHVAYVGSAPGEATSDEPREPRVRIVAPFDPLVWDRRRFEHLWGWDYRFEAYVPAPKRRYGYYALPLVWDDGDDVDVIGWVNASVVSGARLNTLVIETGFVKPRPKGPVFRNAFDAEIERLRVFLDRAED